jgi:hypothetical protein
VHGDRLNGGQAFYFLPGQLSLFPVPHQKILFHQRLSWHFPEPMQWLVQALK